MSQNKKPERVSPSGLVRHHLNPPGKHACLTPEQIADAGVFGNPDGKLRQDAGYSRGYGERLAYGFAFGHHVDG